MTTDSKPSVNSLAYLNQLYSGDWKAGYQEAYVRLDKDISLLEKFDKHLDIGCADGYFTKKYLEKYPDTEGFGVDLSDIVISQINDPKFVVADCYHLPYLNDYFDLVHCAEVLEHLERPTEALREMKRVLKKGGQIVLTTPYKEQPLYEEHLWSWAVEDVCNLAQMRLYEADEKFFNNIMRLIFIK